MPFFLVLIAVFIVSFLLGSIPSGVLVSKLVYQTDVRDYGSGNIGTTNAFRALGKVGGCAVFVLDFVKGLLASFIAGLIYQWFLAINMMHFGNVGAYQVVMALSFLAVVSGHIYTPWLNFKGGKGIACAVGSLFIVFGFIPTLIEIALFAVLVVTTKKVSVGSIAAAIACPIISLYIFWGNMLAWILMTITAVMVLYAHRSNISRLRDHSESTIGGNAKSKKDALEDVGEDALEDASDTSSDEAREKIDNVSSAAVES